MESNLSIECNPTTVAPGSAAEFIITHTDSDETIFDRILVVEVLQPADGAVIYREEVSFSKAAEVLKVVWRPDDQVAGGLYQVSACFRGEELHTLGFVIVASATAEIEAQNIREALVRRMEAAQHLQDNNLAAAAAALEAAATWFSSSHAHESALACWREAAFLQVKLGLYGNARVALCKTLSALFETIRLRLKNPFLPDKVEVPVPEHLPLSYSDVDGVRELAVPIRSKIRFDPFIESRIKEHVDKGQPVQKLYGLLLLCEEFSVEGEYYERLLHEYYEIPSLKDVCWVGLARCDQRFADEALRLATEVAISKPRERTYREFLSGSFAILGQVDHFIRNAMECRVEVGSHLMLELSKGAKLQFGGKHQHFTISDKANNTLAEILINDHTQHVLLPLLMEQFKGTKSRLGQLLAR